ncbi:MAG TPA: hypothetical protein VFU89_06280 [Rhabdochlamydiaceae bacterium]|nr:hypothetical protein [Rhabdochlamydiaceae bacterium]
MTAIKNGLLLAESIVTGIGPAYNNLVRALSSEGSKLCVAESNWELAGGCGTLSNYLIKIFNTLGTAFHLFTHHIPSQVIAIGHAMNLLGTRASVGVIGLATSTFQLVKESISYHRQMKFLSIFKKAAWTGQETKVALETTIANFDNEKFQQQIPLKLRNIIKGNKGKLNTLLRGVNSGDEKAIKIADRVFQHWAGRNVYNHLVEIAKLPEVEIERALPDWMNSDLLIQGGAKAYLTDLLQRVDKGEQKAGNEATKLIETVHSYAAKKRMVHIIKILGAVMGIIGCISFFVVCPLAFVITLTVISILIAVAAYMYNAGYVENREDRFSFKLCIPEAIRNAPASLSKKISKCADKISAKINAKIAPKKPEHFHLYDERAMLPYDETAIAEERLQRRARLAAHFSAA